MTTRRQERKIALAEIFFIAKEEYDVLDKSREEEELYDMLETFKHKLKKKCKNHFKLEE